MKINRYTDFNESKQGSTQKYLKEKKLLSDVNLLVNNKDKWENLYNGEEDMSVYELLGTIGFETEPYIANDIVETIIRYNPNEDNGFDYDYIVSGIEFFVGQLSRILKIEPLIQEVIDLAYEVKYSISEESDASGDKIFSNFITVSIYIGSKFEDFYEMFEVLKVVKSRKSFEMTDIMYEVSDPELEANGMIKIIFNLNA